jgi:hypothetical protein
LALEKDNAAIGAGLVSEIHIGIEASPVEEFDGPAGDLSRCPVEWAIEGLEIGKNPVVSRFSVLADRDACELAFGRYEPHGIHCCSAKRRSSGLQFVRLRPARVLDFLEGIGF